MDEALANLTEALDAIHGMQEAIRDCWDVTPATAALDAALDGVAVRVERAMDALDK